MKLKLIQIYFKSFSFFSPKTAAKQAFNFFQQVRFKTIREREQIFYNQAKTLTFEFDHDKMEYYAFGQPNNELVLLIHGWDSNAGCMYELVQHLLKANKYVLVFNLPAHGLHKAKSTNLYESKNVFKYFLTHIIQNNRFSIVSHSFGSGVTAYALSELNINVKHLVFLTSPNHVIDIFNDYKTLIKLGDKAYNILLSMASDVIGEPMQTLKIEDKLKLATFNHLCLIHDKFDKVIPYNNSVQIHKAITNSTLIPFEHIGHYRMLWNKEVIATVIKCLEK